MTPEEILEKLRQKWDDLMAKAQQLLEAFNNTLDKISRFAGWIAEKAVNFWNDHVVPKWQEAVDWMGEHWNVFGAPWLCFGSAGEWRTLVGQPFSIARIASLYRYGMSLHFSWVNLRSTALQPWSDWSSSSISHGTRYELLPCKREWEHNKPNCTQRL